MGSIFVAGSGIGLVKNGFYYEQIAFIYKYFLIAIIPYIYIRLTRSAQDVNALLKLWTVSFIFLCIWPIIRFYLDLIGLINVHFRADFPLASKGTSFSTAGHLYSTLLSFGLYFMFLKKRFLDGTRFKLIHILFLCCSIISLILCGSRGWVFVSVIMLLVFFASYYKQFFTTTLLKWSFVFLGIVLIIVPVYIGKVSMMSEAERRKYWFIVDTVARTTQINIFKKGDESTGARIDKFIYVLKEIKPQGFLIGNGIFNTGWFDNAIAQFLYTSGLFGLAIFIVIIKNFIAKAKFYAIQNNKRNEFIVFKYTLYFYIFANALVTEFILVTRSIFPSLSLIILLYLEIKLSNSNQVKVANKNQIEEENRPFGLISP